MHSQFLPKFLRPRHKIHAPPSPPIRKERTPCSERAMRLHRKRLTKEFLAVQRYLAEQDIKVFAEFCGWAGKRSNIGPAYIIRLDILREHYQLFYIDDDLAHQSVKTLEEFGHRIQTESVGLCFMGIERIRSGISGVRSYNTVFTGLIFDFNNTRMHDQKYVNGKVLALPDDQCLLVIPKAGEFSLLIGTKSDDGRYDLECSNDFCIK